MIEFYLEIIIETRQSVVVMAMFACIHPALRRLAVLPRCTAPGHHSPPPSPPPRLELSPAIESQHAPHIHVHNPKCTGIQQSTTRKCMATDCSQVPCVWWIAALGTCYSMYDGVSCIV